MHTKDDMIRMIDAEADIIRTRVVGDPVRAFEYQWTEREAVSYRDAGYAGTVPVSVAIWAQAKGWTPQQATDDILLAAENFRGAMAALRSARLNAKEAIRAAEDDAAANVAFQAAMSTFTNLRSQIIGEI